MDAGLIQALAAQGSSGNAGSLEAQVGRLTLSGGAKLDSSTRGSGRGGTLTVAATDMIAIAGRDSQGNPSGLFSNTQGHERGGDIDVAVTHLQLSNGGIISASSTGTGDAGTIRLQIGDTFRSDNGMVTTATEGAGGGAIALTAGRLVHLINSEVTTTVRGGGGDAGNIMVDSPFIVLEGSQIIANAFEGMGGNIRIGAEVFLADPASLVSASSTLGIQGTVDIQSPITSLSGALAPLPQAFVSAAALLPTRCAARAPGSTYSSLILSGREGLPLDPGGLLPSPVILDPRVGADPAGAGEPHRSQTTSGFALLHGADKGFPRLQGGTLQGGSSVAVAWGCSK
jgi:large exoprotein involved in heme utilization and adhesion